jgi:hypothetical protein
MRWFTMGEHIEGLTHEGQPVRAAVFNEVQVRAAAGITLAVGTVAFCYAYFNHQFIPIRAVAIWYFFDFLIRITIGLKYSPTGVLAKALTFNQPPQWVSAKPKRFAWTLGMALSGATAVITNIPIHGYLPRTLCLLCLGFMWLETALGLCLGCQIHAFMVRRGWRRDDPAYEICAGGVCELPSTRAAADPAVDPAGAPVAGSAVAAAAGPVAAGPFAVKV